jgi:hypothetical protein
MPLSGTGDAWGTAVKAAIPAPPQDRVMNESELLAVWQAIKGVDVSHITGNAVVSTGVAVASVSGVTPGPGVSGPGTGTGTGTVG